MQRCYFRALFESGSDPFVGSLRAELRCAAGRIEMDTGVASPIPTSTCVASRCFVWTKRCQFSHRGSYIISQKKAGSDSVLPASIISGTAAIMIKNCVLLLLCEQTNHMSSLSLSLHPNVFSRVGVVLLLYRTMDQPTTLRAPSTISAAPQTQKLNHSQNSISLNSIPQASQLQSSDGNLLTP